MKEIHLPRLSFIKYLFELGVSQSHQPEPLCSVSVLTFHDSVELFLQLCTEELNVSKQDIKFMAYFDVIDAKLKDKSTELSLKGSMKRLNTARVSFKHAGTKPSKSDIDDFRANVLTFFNENCPKVFGLVFSDISLIDLIEYERSRDLLKEAKQHFDKNEIKEAAAKLGESFAFLLWDHEKSIKNKLGESPYIFIDTWYSSPGRLTGEKRLDEFIGKTHKSINLLQDALKIITFGIDFKKFTKFKFVTPVVLMTNGGYAHTYFPADFNMTKQSFDFCMNFIVESALRLQEFDFEIVGG